MAVSFAEKHGVSRGQQPAPPIPMDQQESLFPSELRISEHVRWFVRYTMKQIGVRIWGGEPEKAETNLARTLDPRSGKHFHIDWLDYVVEELGPSAAVSIVNMLCDRWGLERTKPKVPSAKLVEQADSVLEQAALLVRANAELVEEMKLLRDALRLPRKREDEEDEEEP